MRYGLIGMPLGHSHSPAIHRALGGYDYALCPLTEEELAEFFRRREFCGINVTIPYKQAVIPYCSALTARAEHIGSVNTIVRRADGSLLGDNTDFEGLRMLCEKHGIVLRGKKILIFGSGGTSLTARAVAAAEGAAEIIVVSRKGPVRYENLPDHRDADVLFNTTPLGMYPNPDAMVVSLDLFHSLSGVVDVVYNPLRTRLVLAARERGIPAAGGLYMLVAQAKAAAEEFLGTEIPQPRLEEIYRDLHASLENIILIGMAGCGKTTIGREVAQRTGRDFIDTDEEIVRRRGMEIPQIFAAEGEEGFRLEEQKVIAEVSQRSGVVIATGGGAVLRESNRNALRSNGRLYWLTRPLELLPTEGRPLSNPETLHALYQQRLPVYRGCADCQIQNEGSVEAAAERITEEFYEASRD